MSINDFRQFDASDLIINIWYYNQNKKHLHTCGICQKYISLSIQALQEKWEEDWGDMNYLVRELNNCSRYFDFGLYSSATKHQIIDYLKRYNKKN